MSRMKIWLLLAVMAATIVALTFMAGRGAIAARSLPSRPNFVVIMTDDQDMDSLPVMRNLMARIGGGWIDFTAAFANDAKCCPSRATFLTGQYSHHHGVTANGRGQNLVDNATLAVWLDNMGYHTGLVGKYLIGYPWDLHPNYRPPGWDVFLASYKPVDKHTHLALDFLDSAPEAEPFFLYLAYTAPHHEATPPERYQNASVYMPPRRPNFNEADVSDKPLWVRREPPLSEATIRQWDKERANSQRELLAIDDGFLAIMQKLEQQGRLDNTIVIFLADQGFSWGSHRWIYKNCPYVECSQFPLFIRVPGGPNRVEPRLVSNVDLAPTIAELAGASISGLVPDGRSFARLLTDPAAPWTEGVLMERHHGDPPSLFYAVQTAGYMYSEYENGDVELYDMAADPYQMTNVVDELAYQTVREEMDALLAEMLAGEPLPTPTATLTPTATSTAVPVTPSAFSFLPALVRDQFPAATPSP